MPLTDPAVGTAHGANGGCSDDGFDYFCGWLITQGPEAFERVVADPGRPGRTAHRSGLRSRPGLAAIHPSIHPEQRKRCPPRLPAHRRPSARL
ncbi:DUF4240 domain-containing protein [Streptomyces sp. NPDC000075]|uniref:DUF4240 domain-containing protein n=1 Tax=Streptomyces TaxID=1883 RepID=UPI0031D6CD11